MNLLVKYFVYRALDITPWTLTSRWVCAHVVSESTQKTYKRFFKINWICLLCIFMIRLCVFIFKPFILNQTKFKFSNDKLQIEFIFEEKIWLFSTHNKFTVELQSVLRALFPQCFEIKYLQLHIIQIKPWTLSAQVVSQFFLIHLLGVQNHSSVTKHFHDRDSDLSISGLFTCRLLLMSIKWKLSPN